MCARWTHSVCWMWRTRMCTPLEAMLSRTWKCLISYNTNQSLSALPVLPSLPLLSSFPPSLSLQVLPLIALPQLFSPLCRYPLTYFSLHQTHFPPVPYQQPSLLPPSHPLCLPLYKWWEAGVVFSAHLFICSPLFCCLCVWKWWGCIGNRWCWRGRVKWE